MGNKRKEIPLSQLYDFRSGLSKPRSEFGFGYGFLSFKDVFYNYFVPEKLDELVNSTEKERESCSIRRGDVFLTRTSETMEELGMSCVALKDYESATFNGFTKRLRPKEGTKIVPEYAGYYFRSPKFRSEVTAMSTLSTRASLNNEMLGRLMMVLPSLEEQTAIGVILKAFDDKIELNRRMNATLEAIARAIFKSWFVDFGPVRAKAERLDPGLPKEIADLFPNSFEISVLGKIPRGWKVKQIGDEIEFVYGKALKASDRKPGNFPVYGSHGPVGIHSEALVQGPGIVIGRKGNPGTIKWVSGDFFPIDTTFYVKLIGSISSLHYLFYALKAQNLPSLSADSAVPGLNRNIAYMNDLIIPPKQLLLAYDKQIISIFNKIDANNIELQILSSLRDTLLPKLISGELSIPNFDKFLKEAGI